MGRVLIRFFAILGVIFTLVALLAVGATFAYVAPEPLPGSMVLEVNLERGLTEHVPDDPLLLTLERRTLTVREVVDALHRAADDERVKGLLVRVAGGGFGMGVVEELREAVEHFRSTGKPATVFSETFGEFAPGHGGYYLATAFDEIVLQPSGDVGLTGLAAEAPFVRGTLERAGVVPQLDQREEYKGVADVFTEDGFTEAAREANEFVLEGVYGEIVGGIAGGRGLPVREVRRLLRDGPFGADEAEAAGLVDRLAYRDEVLDGLRDRLGEDVEVVSPRRYRRSAGSTWSDGATVALIYGTGPVVRGETTFDPVLGGVSMGSETVARAIREAVDDPSVEAILFRVDSPGGSYVASDVIHREVVRARERGTPVVVSMGNVAGSGGYLVSAGAARIVAQPSTITGSIGVVGGKAVTQGLWEQLGVSWDVVEVGEGSAMWSMIRPYGDEEWAHVQSSLDRIYDAFVEKVAEGRPLDRDEVLEVAGGRIWTGRQAMERGLVDELGGFSTALEAVREEAGVEPGAPLQIVVRPPERTLLEVLLEEGRFTVGARPGGELLRGVYRAYEPVRRALVRTGWVRPPGPVRVPHVPTVPE